jgi:hypothetical protein
MHTPSHFVSARLHTVALVCAALLLSGTVLAVAGPAQAVEDTALARGADLCAQAPGRAARPRGRDRAGRVQLQLRGHPPQPRAELLGRPRVVANQRLLAPRGLRGLCLPGRLQREAAYRISARGRNFQPWATYRGGQYRRFMAPARAAVNRLAPA